MNGELNLRMDTIREFLTKIRALFLIFKKGRGGLPTPSPPPSCAPVDSPYTYIDHHVFFYKPGINPIQDGHFRGCSRMGRGQKKPSSLPKICHTYPTIMKIGTVMPYLKKMQKIYGTRDIRLDFCWQQHFFTGNRQMLLYQEIQI